MQRVHCNLYEASPEYLGGTFDLISFRSAPPGAFSAGGVDGLRGYSTNTIAIQVPIRQLTRNRNVAPW